MKTMNLSRCGVCIWAAFALLSGCGGSQPPISAPGAMLQSTAIATQAGHGRSWMLSEAKSDNLLYIDDQATSTVYVYSYPKGKLVGTITGKFHGVVGMCVDAVGDVFVPQAFGHDILEYAHGGTRPKATLSDAGEFPSGCGVDPTTGNLAVANYCSGDASSCAGLGGVAIYVDAKGSPTQHTSADISNGYFCGYDTKGNLFLDGTQKSAFAFAELRSGKSTFTKIKLNQTIQIPGNVQWEGAEVAVGDDGTGMIYQFTVSGKSGTEVGSTTLTGSSYVTQFWIQTPNVIGPNTYSSGGNVLFWKYPAGGSPTKTIGGLSKPVGATVSLAR